MKQDDPKKPGHPNKPHEQQHKGGAGEHKHEPAEHSPQRAGQQKPDPKHESEPQRRG